MSKVRALMETKIMEKGMDRKQIIAAGRQITYEMFGELGLRPDKVVFDEIDKFEKELDVISDILNKEDGIVG